MLSEALLAQRFAPAPTRGAALCGYLLGRPRRPPFFINGNCLPQIPLTKDESISSLFRVEKRLHLLGYGVVGLMADTDRRPVTLAVASWEFLDQLSRLGTHGTSVPDVAKTLIEEGIRQAIKDGFLKQSSLVGPRT